MLVEKTQATTLKMASATTMATKITTMKTVIVNTAV